MRDKLKQFCDACKYFLVNVSSIQECLVEAQKTQQSLAELIELKAEIETEFRTKERKFDSFLADKREAIVTAANRTGVKNVTERFVDDRVKKFEQREYNQLKEDFDNAKIEFDVVSTLLMAMFQRKDLISETISFFKTKKDAESCIMKHKDIMRKLGL